jgi:hypothetical protein
MEVVVVLDLPAAYVGVKQAAQHTTCQDSTGLPGMVLGVVESRTEVALEREWRLTIALILKQLPTGSCVTVRDAKSRAWYIGPADQAIVNGLREAA